MISEANTSKWSSLPELQALPPLEGEERVEYYKISTIETERILAEFDRVRGIAGLNTGLGSFQECRERKLRRRRRRTRSSAYSASMFFLQLNLRKTVFMRIGRVTDAPF